MDEPNDLSNQSSTPSAPRNVQPPRDRRKWWRLALLVSGPAVVAIVAGYLYLSGGRYQSTDDAYVESAKMAISADISGRVVEVAVHDNQLVRRGEVLFRLDEAPLKIAVDEAKAQLASAKLQIDMLKANYRQRQSDLASAEETLSFQQNEFNRQQRLFQSGVASQSQVDGASHALDEAQARLASARQQIGAVVANLGGDPNIAADRHPAVEQAQALLDRARLNLSYAVVTAPSDGIVTRVDELQVGSYIAASAPVFALVSTQDSWITANFKEDQLTHVRVGQAVAVEVDSYPGKSFRGSVASLSPGTGSQFSVLPAENATGNWVKVVQRLPVRIRLEQPEQGFPLLSGLSANVTVDTRYQRHAFGAPTTNLPPQSAKNP